MKITISFQLLVRTVIATNFDFYSHLFNFVIYMNESTYLYNAKFMLVIELKVNLQKDGLFLQSLKSYGQMANRLSILLL